MISEKNRLIIVEDDAKLSDVLKYLFDSSENFTWCGTAASYDEAVELLQNAEADIAIVDINLKGKNSGIDVIAYISANFPDIQIAAHTMYEDSETIFDVLKAGAHGYILKGTSPVELFHRISDICSGNISISPKIARKVLSYFSEILPQEELNLSAQELRVLKLADRGYSYKQIGEELHITRNTVNSHFKNIYRKLHVSSQEKAIKKAKRLSLM